MSNNKQSSVEWQFEQLSNSFETLKNTRLSFDEYFKRNLEIREQAKAMHKEEMINFHIQVMNLGLIEEGESIWQDAYLPKISSIANQQYNETFGGNK